MHKRRHKSRKQLTRPTSERREDRESKEGRNK